jgi:hypothetical protein
MVTSEPKQWHHIALDLDILGDNGPPVLAQELHDRVVLNIHAEAALTGSDPQIDHVTCWLPGHGGLRKLSLSACRRPVSWHIHGPEWRPRRAKKVNQPTRHHAASR